MTGPKSGSEFQKTFVLNLISNRFLLLNLKYVVQLAQTNFISNPKRISLLDYCESSGLNFTRFHILHSKQINPR